MLPIPPVIERPDDPAREKATRMMQLSDVHVQDRRERTNREIIRNISIQMAQIHQCQPFDVSSQTLL